MVTPCLPFLACLPPAEFAYMFSVRSQVRQVRRQARRGLPPATVLRAMRVLAFSGSNMPPPPPPSSFLPFHRPLLSCSQAPDSLHNGGVKSETVPTFSHHHSVKQVSKLHDRKFGMRHARGRNKMLTLDITLAPDEIHTLHFEPTDSEAGRHERHHNAQN